MIIGTKITPQSALQVLLEKMHSIPDFTFHATGSRKWTDSETADWDFFAEYEVRLVWWLEDAGFQKITTAEYDQEDPSIVAVYRRTFENENCWIDVQLINPLYMERKQAINEVYAAVAPQSCMTKEGWKQWWRTMFQQWPSRSNSASGSHTHLDINIKNALNLLEKNKIPTIKGLRERYGLGLVEAKDRVDMLFNGKIAASRIGVYRRED